jgi:hypothetical protein
MAETSTTSKTVRGTGTLEQDGEITTLRYLWKCVTEAGRTTVTLEVVHSTASVVYRAVVAGVEAAAFDELAQYPLQFAYSTHLNEYTVMGDPAVLSDGLRLHPVEDALLTVVRRLEEQLRQSHTVRQLSINIPYGYYDGRAHLSWQVYLIFDVVQPNAEAPAAILPTSVAHSHVTEFASMAARKAGFAGSITCHLYDAGESFRLAYTDHYQGMPMVELTFPKRKGVQLVHKFIQGKNNWTVVRDFHITQL